MPALVLVLKENISLILKLGAGFFADAYDLFVVDIVLAIFSQLNTDDPAGLGYTTFAVSAIASATAFGAIVGMIVFGLVGDYIGRRVAVLITGSLVATGSILSACCMRSENFSLMSQLVICRAILGFGIGGEYPLSATIASEGVSSNIRDRIVAGVFSMQGFGMLVSSLLGYIFCVAGVSLEITWRFLLAFGCVPALVALKFRIAMHEYKPTIQEGNQSRGGSVGALSSRNVSIDNPKQDDVQEGLNTSSSALANTTANVLANTSSSFVAQNGAASSTNGVVPLDPSVETKTHWSVVKKYSHLLFGTMICWFLLDVTFYGTGEFKHSVSESIYGDSTVQSSTFFSLMISLMALPGYLCTVIFIDRIGRWTLQFAGFLATACMYALMGISVKFSAPSGVQFFIFGLCFFFTNFGPNATTFIIPSEIFPSLVRATCHGMSAAAGKSGAVLGGFGFPIANSAIGLANVMYICSSIAASGALATYVFLPKKIVQPNK